MASCSTSTQSELEVQLKEAGNRLLMPPSSVDQLLNLLDGVECLLCKVAQAPCRSMQHALLPSMKALIADELLRHSDMDVKVSVASCISEITRITAPDAPYNDEKMKEIFELTILALEKLSNVSGRCYSKAIEILDTFAHVRLCLLMLDMEFDSLIVQMFRQFLSSIRSDHPLAVFTDMETIMTMVIKETEKIPLELFNLLLTSVKKENQNDSPFSLKLGEKVLKNCAAKLSTCLPEAVKPMKLVLADYAEIVASICQHSSKREDMNQAADEVSLDVPSSREDGKFVDGPSNSVMEEDGNDKNGEANTLEKGNPLKILERCHQTKKRLKSQDSRTNFEPENLNSEKKAQDITDGEADDSSAKRMVTDNLENGKSSKILEHSELTKRRKTKDSGTDTEAISKRRGRRKGLEVDFPRENGNSVYDSNAKRADTDNLENGSSLKMLERCQKAKQQKTTDSRIDFQPENSDSIDKEAVPKRRGKRKFVDGPSISLTEDSSVKRSDGEISEICEHSQQTEQNKNKDQITDLQPENLDITRSIQAKTDTEAVLKRRGSKKELGVDFPQENGKYVDDTAERDDTDNLENGSSLKILEHCRKTKQQKTKDSKTKFQPENLDSTKLAVAKTDKKAVPKRRGKTKFVDGPSDSVIEDGSVKRSDGDMLKIFEHSQETEQQKNKDQITDIQPENLDSTRSIQAKTDTEAVLNRRGRRPSSLVKLEEGYYRSLVSGGRKGNHTKNSLPKHSASKENQPVFSPSNCQSMNAATSQNKRTPENCPRRGRPKNNDPDSTLLPGDDLLGDKDKEKTPELVASKKRCERRRDVKGKSLRGYKKSEFDSKTKAAKTILGDVVVKQEKEESGDMTLASLAATTTFNRDENDLNGTSKTKRNRKNIPRKEEDPESSRIAKEYGEELVGRKIRVWWPLDKVYYEGTISSFDPVKRKHMVLYEDGDKEVLNLSKERWNLVDNESPDQGREADHPMPAAAAVKTRKRKAKPNLDSVVKQENGVSSSKRPQQKQAQSTVVPVKQEPDIFSSRSETPADKSKTEASKSIHKKSNNSSLCIPDKLKGKKSSGKPETKSSRIILKLKTPRNREEKEK